MPGSIGRWVSITDAKKKILPPHAPYPVGFKNIKTDSETYIENKESDSQPKMTNDEKLKTDFNLKVSSEKKSEVETTEKTDNKKNKAEQNEK